jgi:aminoglycoside 3-N-acetyltransferase I
MFAWEMRVLSTAQAIRFMIEQNRGVERALMSLIDLVPWQIKRLGAEDVALARAMNALFADAFEDPESYATLLPDASYLAGLLSNAGTIALVALAEERIVGALTAYTLPKFEQARSEIYIYDLAVAEGFRRRGIATALLDAVQDIASETSAWAVFVQADYCDEPAIALYTKLGIREDVMHFDLNRSQGELT